MRPTDLRPGDILLYRDAGWVSKLISWFEWNGESKEATEYAHIGLVASPSTSAEMNPPASRAFDLAQVPWDLVDVWRVGVNGQAMMDDPMVLQKFTETVNRRLGEKYNYGYIATAMGVGLLARIGLNGLSRWILARPNPAPDHHRDVCSTWAEEVLTEAIQVVLKDFDFFPDLGENRARPSDWPRSPFIHKV